MAIHADCRTAGRALDSDVDARGRRRRTTRSVRVRVGRDVTTGVTMVCELPTGEHCSSL